MRILFARLWRWLFWSKENREILDRYLNQFDNNLDELNRIITNENSDTHSNNLPS